MAKKTKNLKDVSVADLTKKLGDLRAEILSLKFKAEGAKSKNVKEVSFLKKEVARILTVLNKNIKNK